MKNRFSILFLALVSLVIISGCEDEVGPILPNASEFVAPVFLNSETKAAIVFEPEKAQDVFEEFEWEQTKYGKINLSTTYSIEVDKTPNFEAPVTVGNSGGNKLEVLVRSFNNALLALNLTPYEEHTVYVRVKSLVNTIGGEPLYSSIVSRIVTPYKISDCGNFCSIGLIGSATPGGWNNDTDLHLSNPEDKFNWTVTLFLIEGDVKLRAGDDWADNWGGNSLSGTGVPGGADIHIPSEGYYTVKFNDQSLEYSITLATVNDYTTIGVIGSATTGGWDSDTDLTKDSNDPHLWTGTITLTDGLIKFRANDGWDINWGGPSSRSGYGYGGGPDIGVNAGTYFITFHDVTGEYHLINPDWKTPFETISLIGSAVGGWGDSNDKNLIQNPDNAYLWSGFVTIVDGEVKFRANHAWGNNWGAGLFPSGYAAHEGANIPASSGTYFVTFNSGTGEYRFLN
jgi:hypothetical protein